MHEAILTRGEVRGNKELLPEIMVPENCVLVHSSCHEHANSTENTKRCIADLIKHEGYKSVISWLLHMDALMKSGLPREKIQLVKEVYDEMRDLR